jgi:Tfp pilus assembly protein PilX
MKTSRISHYHRSTLLLLMHLQRVQRQDRGYTLVVTIIAILLLTTLLITAALMSKVDSTSTNASRNSNSGFYSAEAGLNMRAGQVRQAFEGFNRPSGTSPTSWENCVDAATTNNGSDDFECDTTLTINGQRIASYVIDRTGSNPASITIPSGMFAGLNAQEYRYDVFAAALKQEGSFQVPTSILGMRFKSRLIPLFQFAVFYENDADYYNPPNMTMNGRIHSNHDLYLAATTSATLSLNGTVTTAGTLYRGSKANEGTEQCVGTVRIAKENGSFKDLACNGNAITSYLAATTTPSNISDWGNKIKIGINPLTTPPIQDLDPIPGRKYWDAADLRIVLKLDTSNNPVGITIRNQDNTINDALTGKLLQSCPRPTATLNNDTDGTPNYEAADTTLSVSSVSGFTAGDVVTLLPSNSVDINYNVDTHLTGYDLDSNVIRSGGVVGSSIQLKRQLAHSYQASPVAPGLQLRKAVVSTSDTFYNYREKHLNTNITSGQGAAGRKIRMLNVDVRALLDCVHSQNLMDGKVLSDKTQGGMVWYFTVDGPESNINRIGNIDTSDASRVGSTYGVRLYNGKHLFSTISGAPQIKGLTIISDQAVYLRGDYNVNENDPATSVTETWKPSSILSDTINVLSNAWDMDDSDGIKYDSSNLPSIPTYYYERIPTETTMNVAMVSGAEISGGANGAATQLQARSGGINNYFRFHEHWGASVASSTTQACDSIYSTKPTRHCFNYRGSFVSLSEPRRVNSDMCSSYNEADCNIYTPPVRNWDYDTRFNDAANLPPITPRAVYLTQELFEREFTYTSFSSFGIDVVGFLPPSGQKSQFILPFPSPAAMFSY